MEILGKSIITGNGDEIELSIELKANSEEVNKCEKEFFKEISQNKIKGFRKGKAPKPVLENAVGGHQKACDFIAERIFNEYGIPAIDDDDVLFLEEPSFNYDGDIKLDKPLMFTVSGQIAPEIEISNVEPVEIDMPPDEATEKEIDKQIETILDAYHTFEDIKSKAHKIKKGDYVSLKMTVTQQNGSAIKGLDDVERLVGIGKGTMPAGFDKGITGLKVGENAEFDFEVDPGDDVRNFGDGKLHAQVEILKIQKYVLPELDDAFAQTRGAKDVEDLRKQIKYQINIEKNKQLPALMEQRVLSAMCNRYDGEIPEYYIAFIRQLVSQEFMKNLQDNDTDLREWILSNGAKKEEIKAEIQAEAENRAIKDLVLDAFYRQLKLEITEEDIDKFLKNEKDPEEVKKSWAEAHHMADLHKLVRHQKVISTMVKSAKVNVVE